MSQSNKNDLARWLDNFLNKLLYGQAYDTLDSESQYIGIFILIKEQTKVRKFLIEKRQHSNYTILQQLFLNAKRFADGFELILNSKNPEMVINNTHFVMELSGLPLNNLAFLPTIRLLASQEQQKSWVDDILKGRILGCYAQTEIGHGSDVQGLETQAHFDQERKVWRIKSPKITSTKFFPGCMGLFATHAILFAKTWVKGKNIGLQSFMIEIRDENMKLKEGIRAGDVGEKIGGPRFDNGYLNIDAYETPLNSMLMKYIKVLENGEVLGLQNKANLKYGYGSMLNLRVQLVNMFAFLNPIIQGVDLYHLPTSQKTSAIKYICFGIGNMISNMHSKQLYNRFIERMKRKQFEQADEELAKCHIVSSTFKALVSWQKVKIMKEIVTMKRETGINTSHFPKVFLIGISATTYEGDNSVLLQQTARQLIMRSSPDSQKKRTPKMQFRDDDLESAVEALEYMSNLEVLRVKEAFEREVGNGSSIQTTWNVKLQKEIIELAKLWGTYMLLQTFNSSFKQISENQTFLRKIGQVYCSMLLQYVPNIYFYGFNIEQTTPQNNFTKEEIEALVSLRHPFQQRDPHKFVFRETSWMQAKL